jgi:S1-C subfamily serine protease
MAAHLREAALVGVGLLAALAFVLISTAIRPPEKPLSPRDVTRLVEKFMKEKKPDPSFASLAYERVRPSLVLVKGMALPAGGGEPDFALGTGVVIEDETGMILTALHVVRNATAVRVVFHDGFETDAALVSAQPENDLAVLKPAVIPDDLMPATLAGSGHLNPGDDVVAVGNPFGISNSVSVGVVSGLGRSFEAPQTGETLRNLIQFDAAVNPGNSGGPLLDRNGEVVGIVSALLNPTEQEFFVGIGFAVTIETAASALGLPPW